MPINFDLKLAIKLSEIVNEHCQNVPLDIGAVLAKEVFLYSLEKSGKRGAEAGTKLRESINKGFIKE